MPETELIRHSDRKTGTEKAIDLLNPDTGEHIIPKYESFCLEYAQHFSPKLAMAAAGYPVEEKTEHQMQCSFRYVMQRQDVQMRLQSLIRAKATQLGVGPDWVVMKWLEVLDRCMQKEQVKDSEGNLTGEWKFDARGANIVLENMGKYLGMFTKANTPQKPVQIHCYFGGKVEQPDIIDGEVIDE